METGCERSACSWLTAHSRFLPFETHAASHHPHPWAAHAEAPSGSLTLQALPFCLPLPMLLGPSLGPNPVAAPRPASPGPHPLLNCGYSRPHSIPVFGCPAARITSPTLMLSGAAGTQPSTTDPWSPTPDVAQASRQLTHQCPPSPSSSHCSRPPLLSPCTNPTSPSELSLKTPIQLHRANQDDRGSSPSILRGLCIWPKSSAFSSSQLRVTQGIVRCPEWIERSGDAGTGRTFWHLTHRGL